MALMEPGPRSKPPVRAHGPGRHGRWITVVLVGVVLAGISAGAVFGLKGSSRRPAASGVVLDRPLPKLPLRDEAGRRTSLAAVRGPVAVPAPFPSLCHAVSPTPRRPVERSR